MDSAFEILILEFGEIPDEEWAAAEEQVITHYSQRLQDYSNGPVSASVETRNIGKGADWIVVAITFASTFAAGFFAIPKAHKLVRESVEEWGHIFSELKSIFDWLTPKKILFPDNYLFLLALSHLDRSTEVDALVFQSINRLPENDPDLRDKEALLFSFTHARVLEQVAVSRQGSILWHNTIELSYADV